MQTVIQRTTYRANKRRDNTGGGVEMTISTVVKFDGGARPNPGPAAIGYIVETGPRKGVTTSETRPATEPSATPLSEG